MAERPPWRSRLRYDLGGRLTGYDEWVQHDLIDRGWRIRGVRRAMIQASVFLAIAAAVPGPLFLHFMLPLFVALGAAFVSAAYGDDLRDRRLNQHKLPIPYRDYGPPPPGSWGTGSGGDPLGGSGSGSGSGPTSGAGP